MKSKIKIISLFLAVVFVFSLSGCTIGTKTKKVIAYPKGSEAQAVLAFNPQLVIEGESVSAFNDINTATVADAKAKTLTALTDNSKWMWTTKSADAWQLRAPYTLDSWRNRGNIAKGKLKAYSYSADGTFSLMCYATNALEVKSFGSDELSEMGILMSTSGDTQENLSYFIETDGILDIPATELTMVKSVGGVESGFMDNADGSIRTAVVNLMVNDTVLWSGEFGKGVGEEGADVTKLEIPDFYDLEVSNGDVVSFGIQLNGEKVDVENPETDKPQPSKKPQKPSKKEEEKVVPATKGLTFVDGYNSRFEVVYPENASIAVQKLGNKIYTEIEKVTEAESRLKTDNTENYPASAYEILVGETNRSASASVYSSLRGYRKNCANDYILTVVGNHVVIAGGTDAALEQAVEFFLSTYLKDDKSEVPADMYHVSRPTVKTLKINGVDVANYTIRTEKYPSILTKRAANQLSQFFAEQCGIVVPVENDQKTTANEILVGLTERSGVSKDTFKSKSLDYVNGFDQEEYNVFFKDGKLFVDAGSDYAANYGVELIKAEFKNNTNLASSFKKSGKYTTDNDASKYSLSDGYGLAWNDEFFTSTKSGSPIENKLAKWVDSVSSGSVATYLAYSPDSPLVTQLLANPTDPLAALLSKKQTDASHGDYYTFSKIVRPGFNKSYGASDNVLWQKAKFDQNTGFYTSRLTTEESMNFRYGIFEARIMAGMKEYASSSIWFHGSSGAETHPEIDLYENFAGTTLVPNVHSWSDDGTHIDHGSKGQFNKTKGKLPAGENFYDTYHYIGMEWDADFLDFYLDGDIFCSIPMTDELWKAFEQKVFPEITYGISGGFYAYGKYPGDKDGIADLARFDIEQKVDYVRIFQKNGLKQKVWNYKSK